MSKYRVTWEVLRSGQPRPYADTEYVVKVIFEHVPWNSKTKDFEPWYMDDDQAREELAKIPGWSSTTRGTWRNHYLDSVKLLPWCNHFDTYLDYVKPLQVITADLVIPHGDPKQEMAAIWEFRTVSPYTD